MVDTLLERDALTAIAGRFAERLAVETLNHGTHGRTRNREAEI